MARPAITDEQREIAVELLANAVRKQRRRSTATRRETDGLLRARGDQAGAAADDRYLQGMLDIVAVLFAGGRATADACLRAARALEAGEPTEP